MSCTNTSKLPVDTLPATSCAVTETGVCPSAKSVPEASDDTSVSMPPASVAVGPAKVTVAPAALVASAT